MGQFGYLILLTLLSTLLLKCLVQDKKINSGTSRDVMPDPIEQVKSSGQAFRDTSFLEFLRMFNKALVERDSVFLDDCVESSTGLTYIFELDWGIPALVKADHFEFGYLNSFAAVECCPGPFRRGDPMAPGEQFQYGTIPTRRDSIDYCLYDRKGVFIDTLSSPTLPGEPSLLYFSQTDRFFDGTREQYEKLKECEYCGASWEVASDKLARDVYKKIDMKLWLVAITVDNRILGFKKIRNRWYWILNDSYYYTCYAGG